MILFITFKYFKGELVLLVELILLEVRICLCLEQLLRIISRVPEHVQHEVREATKCSSSLNVSLLRFQSENKRPLSSFGF